MRRTHRPWEDERTTENGRSVAQNFAAWFAASKVVDSDGAPLVVYHGTRSDITSFSLAKAGSNHFQAEHAFFFTSEPKCANNYAQSAGHGEHGANVLPVFLSLQQPKVIDMPNGDRFDAIAFYDDNLSGGNVFGLQADGRDGVIIRYEKGLLAVAFAPDQIKSAIGNAGLYQTGSSCLTDHAARLTLQRALSAHATSTAAMQALRQHALAR